MSFIITLLTLSYSGALKYHTTDPIKVIKKNNDYLHHRQEVMEALAQFRLLKQEELQFVTSAVCEPFQARCHMKRHTDSAALAQASLSGIAVVAVFSWSEVEDTVWVAKMLWHWSLILSIFALISSAHQRLLRHLPSDKFQEPFDDDKIKLALNLFLSPPVRPKGTNKNSSSQPTREISSRMVWMWQCPVMLMSYSWVLFLVGYGLHVLKPVFDPSQTHISKAVRYQQAQFSLIYDCG